MDSKNSPGSIEVGPRRPHQCLTATSAWLHDVPELSFLALLSFHCLLRPEEDRHLITCQKSLWNCQHQRAQKREDWQASNTCFWNVQESVGILSSRSHTPYDNLEFTAAEHEETFLLPSPSLQRSCRPSPCSCTARAAFLCRARLQKVSPPALAATTLKRRRGVHRVLRSGVEQQSFAHTELPFGALLQPLCGETQKQGEARRRTRYGPSHAGMDHVVSRRHVAISETESVVRIGGLAGRRTRAGKVGKTAGCTYRYDDRRKSHNHLEQCDSVRA